MRAARVKLLTMLLTTQTLPLGVNTMPKVNNVTKCMKCAQHLQ